MNARNSRQDTFVPIERPKLRLIAEFFADLQPSLQAEYSIQNLIPRSGLGVVYGQSGSGKTNVAIDWFLSVSHGISWAGRRTRRRPCIYVAAEAPSSVNNRMIAWRQRHPEIGDPAPAVLIKDQIDLLDETYVTELIELGQTVAKEHGEIGIFVIDTLACSFGNGDENSGPDMARLITAVKRIQNALGCFVLLIHHAGKDESRGARGHSNLRAAVDVEIEIRSSEQGHTAKVRKQRDLPTGSEFEFQLRAEQIGETVDGDAITVSVVDSAKPAGASHSTDASQLSPAEQTTLATLHRALSDPDARIEATPAAIAAGAKQGQWMLPQSSWKTAAIAAGISHAKNAEGKSRAFNRARDELVYRGYVRLVDSWAFLPSNTEEGST